MATATLRLVQATPASALLRFTTDDAGLSAYLRKSGAGADDVALSSLAEGPLKACLQRSTDWSTLGDRIGIELTLDGCHTGTIYNQVFSYLAGPPPNALGPVGQWLNDRVLFLSGPGPVQCTFEIRYIRSAQR